MLILSIVERRGELGGVIEQYVSDFAETQVCSIDVAFPPGARRATLPANIIEVVSSE